MLDVDNLTKEGTLRKGLEDPKLFYRDDAWHFTCVTMEKGHTEKARMAICRLSDDLKSIVAFEKFAGVDAHRPEKNWMLSPEPNEFFDWIYGPTSTIKNNKMITHMSDNKQIASLRGNSNLYPLEDGTYLAVVHRLYTRIIMTNNHRFYVHYFAKYDKRGKLNNDNASQVLSKINERAQEIENTLSKIDEHTAQSNGLQSKLSELYKIRTKLKKAISDFNKNTPDQKKIKNSPKGKPKKISKIKIKQIINKFYILSNSKVFLIFMYFSKS
jgi:hypothetical protein